MDPHSVHHDVTAFIELLLIASLVAVVLQRIRLPYTVALVAVGIGLGALDVIPGVHISPELVLILFLPGLLFEAAQHIDARSFARDARVIGTLAIPGVLVSILLTGAGVYWGLHLLGVGTGLAFFGIACVLGAMVAATDPISVIALFRSYKAPPRLSLLLEGESLFNDGTAIVCFTILLEVVTGGHVSVAAGLREFCLVAFGGAALGLAAGGLVERALRTTEDNLVELGMTVVLAYGVFLAAEAIHVSGVIAVVVAGIVNGNVGVRTGVNALSRITLYSFWEFAAFVINSMVFLLMGLSVDLPDLWRDRWPILIAAGAMLVARAVAIYGLAPLAGRFGSVPIPRAWYHVLYWGGLRGALSIVLAMSLPAGFPHRDLLVHIVFGIVVLSCFGQGLTMAPLLRRLGLVGAEADAADATLRARLRGHHAAIAHLRALHEERAISAAAFDTLLAREQDALAALETALAKHRNEPGALEAELEGIEEGLRDARRTTILQAYHHHELSAAAADQLLAELAGDGEAHS